MHANRDSLMGLLSRTGLFAPLPADDPGRVAEGASVRRLTEGEPRIVFPVLTIRPNG